MPIYKVGVFEHSRKRSVALEAYVRDYHESWDGCCVHYIHTASGQSAKDLAKSEHRLRCMKGQPAEAKPEAPDDER